MLQYTFNQLAKIYIWQTKHLHFIKSKKFDISFKFF